MLVASFLVLLPVIFLMIANPKETWPSLPVIVMIAAIIWLASTLTIEIKEGFLKFWFGPGIFSKTFDLKEIASCRKTKTHWWYGWGIHLTRKGWLYNVSGFEAVEIKLKTGKTFLLGTNEPEVLEKAIKSNLR